MTQSPPPPPDPSGGYGPPGGQAGGYPPQTPGAAPQLPNAPGAVPSLVLGIVSLACCALCGPFAFLQGRKAEEEVDASAGAYGGRGIATAGKITGIIGSVLLVIQAIVLVLYVIFFIVLAASAGTSQ